MKANSKARAQQPGLFFAACSLAASGQSKGISTGISAAGSISKAEAEFTEGNKDREGKRLSDRTIAGRDFVDKGSNPFLLGCLRFLLQTNFGIKVKTYAAIDYPSDKV